MVDCRLIIKYVLAYSSIIPWKFSNTGDVELPAEHCRTATYPDVGNNDVQNSNTAFRFYSLQSKSNLYFPALVINNTWSSILYAKVPVLRSTTYPTCVNIQNAKTLVKPFLVVLTLFIARVLLGKLYIHI